MRNSDFEMKNSGIGLGKSEVKWERSDTLIWKISDFAEILFTDLQLNPTLTPRWWFLDAISF